MPDERKIENPVASPEVPSAPESIKVPEKKLEQVKAPDSAKKPEIKKTIAQPQHPTNVAPPVAQANDSQEIILHKVESILSDGMEKVYLSMDAGTQSVFKAKGEETSQQISSLLTKTKIQIKQVINLIVDWLRIVPQVNRYYIEQEAKIKADAIMEIYNKNKL